MTLLALFKASPAPRLLYRLHLSWLRLRPPVTVGVRTMIVDDKDRVLLVRHTYRPGWYFPGGGVKRWETLEEAACREAREEAGADPVRLERLVGVYANFMDSRSDHVALYLVREWRTVPMASAEIAEAAFFPMTALPDDATDPTRRRVDEHLGRRQPDNRW